MEQLINRKNRLSLLRPTRWMTRLLFQFVLAGACLTAFAQAEKKGAPPQAQPDSGSGDKEPNTETPATDSSEQSPNTQGPTEEQRPSEPPTEQKQPPQPASEQKPSSESGAVSASDATPAQEIKPVAEEKAPGKPKVEPSAEAKPTAPRPQKTDREEQRISPTSATPLYRVGTVCANGRPAVDNKRSQWPPVRVSGELGFLASQNHGATSTWLSPLFHGWYRVSDMIAVSADWGFAMLNWAGIPESDETSLRSGNPFLAVHSVRQHGCTELRVGIGVSIPLASLPESYSDVPGERDFARELYRGTMAMRGMWDWWLWVPDSMSVALPVSWETAASSDWIFSGEIALASTVFLEGSYAYSIPIDDTLQALLVIPVMGTIGYRIDPVIFSLGLRAVWIVNEGMIQTSTIPGVRLNLGIGFVQARFNLNLDKPFGFGAEPLWSSKLWGLHLGGGIEF